MLNSFTRLHWIIYSPATIAMSTITTTHLPSCHRWPAGCCSDRAWQGNAGSWGCYRERCRGTRWKGAYGSAWRADSGTAPMILMETNVVKIWLEHQKSLNWQMKTCNRALIWLQDSFKQLRLSLNNINKVCEFFLKLFSNENCCYVVQDCQKNLFKWSLL